MPPMLREPCQRVRAKNALTGTAAPWVTSYPLEHPAETRAVCGSGGAFRHACVPDAHLATDAPLGKRLQSQAERLGLVWHVACKASRSS